MRIYLKLLRINHWIKNFLIFTPLFFVQEIFVDDKFLSAVFAFFAFCLAASTVYIFNDINDIRVDKMHPVKKNRPLASGLISISNAWILCTVLFFSSLGISYFLIPQALVWISFYLLLNIAYTIWLKKMVIFDILTVASFYLIRVLVGGMATDVVISSWLILCVFFASLLVVIGKRLGEFSQENKRGVLSQYSQEYLGQLLYISAGLTLVTYGIYTILGFHIGQYPQLVIYSNIIVVLGIFRYLYLVDMKHEIEFPEKIIMKDKTLFLCLLAWVAYMFFIIY